MLRLFVLLLLLLNVTYFAWTEGMLQPYGWAPAPQTEPQRVQQQLRPEAIRVLSAEEARRAEQAALAPPPPPPRPPECLVAGPYEERDTPALRAALESGLPAGSWALEPQVEAAHWIVYMGKYTNRTLLARKRAELAKMKITLQPLTNPALEPGLSLGGYDTEAKAKAELAKLQRRGVRTARVVQEHPEVRRNLLRIPAADDALRARLDGLKPALGDKTLHSCN